MADMKSWEKGPWNLISHVKNGAKDPAVGVQQMTNDMIVIHNIAIRSINAIYLQSINVGKSGSPKDVADFVDYCATWETFLHSHHDEEEEYVFPEIERLSGVPDLMQGNVEQHQAFHDGLSRFGDYVRGVKEGKQEFDGQALVELIDDFMPPLYKHLLEEITTMHNLKKFVKVDWKLYWDKKSAEIIKKNQSDPQATPIILPFAMTAQDNTYEDGVMQWPPIPWVVKQVFKWWFIPTHKNWWRFAPCDSNSRPQELLFATA